MTELGVAVKVAIGYRMVPVEPPAELIAALADSGEPLSVLLYSREAALGFAAVLLAHPTLRTALTGIFCLSAAIAEALPPELGPLARAAPVSNEDRLLDLLAAS